MNLRPVSSRRTLLSLVLAASAWPLVVSGDPLPAAALPGASPQTTVNTTTAGEQSQPAVAIDAEGSYIVAWTSSGQDGDQGGIYSQRFTASGVPRGPETKVNTTTVGDQGDPVVAMDGRGNYVVVWTSSGQDGDQGGIYAQRFTATGAAQGTETLVNTTTAGEQTEPAVAMDVNGDHVIAWTSVSETGTSSDVRSQRYSADGTPQGPESHPYATGDASQYNPAIGMSASGRYVIAWTTAEPDATGIYSRRFNAVAVPQGSPTHVNTTTADVQTDPAVAMDADGDHVVVWSSQNQDGSGWGVYAQQYHADGTADGTETRANTATDDDQVYPTVAIDADGDYVVVWISKDLMNENWGVHAQRYSADGTPEGSELLVNTPPEDGQFDGGGDAYSPSNVALDADGDLVATWGGFVLDTFGYEILARRFRGPQPVDLSVTQADNADPIRVGGRLVYRIRVANRTDESEAIGFDVIDAAIGHGAGVRVIITPPEGATFQSAAGTDWACGVPGTTLTCRLATGVPAGAFAPDLRLTFTAPNDAGPALNSARVTQTRRDSDGANNTATESTQILCTLGFSAASFSRTESGNLLATLTRNGTGCGTSSVAYQTTGGSATAGTDFTDVGDTLTWSEIQTQRSFVVPVTADSLDESNETIKLTITAPTDALLAPRSFATGLVLDDDDPPRINFTSTETTTAETSGLIDVTVQLSEVSGRLVSVALSKSGTAKYLTDYFAPRGLSGPAGQRTATFTVEVVNDTTHESNEAAVISLASPTAATIGSRKTYRLTITAND